MPKPKFDKICYHSYIIELGANVLKVLENSLFCIYCNKQISEQKKAVVIFKNNKEISSILRALYKITFQFLKHIKHIIK